MRGHVHSSGIHQRGIRQALTPQNITTPLPDITQALQPVGIPVDCSDWDLLNLSIAGNPILAAGLLGLAFILLWPRGGR